MLVIKFLMIIMKDIKKIRTPISIKEIDDLRVGDKLFISGNIFTGRDAVLPKLKRKIIENKDKPKDKILVNLEGSVIMHTAVSDAGIAPTTSNKDEIESSIHLLSEAGVRIHIGKGSLSEKTVKSLKNQKSIFVVTPPIAALLTDSVKSKQIVDYEYEGIEAFFKLEVENIPGIVAIAHGKSIY